MRSAAWTAVLIPLLSCARAPVAVNPPAAGEGKGGVDVSLLDRRVDPCDDFYQFACGSWLATAKIPPDRPIWSRGFDTLAERNLLSLKETLEAAAAGRGDPQDADGDKLGAFYGACMDEPAIEKNGPAALAAELARLDRVKDARSLATALGELHLGGAQALFNFGSEQDAKDATQVIFTVAQGGLGLPDRDFYLRTDEHSRKILEAYQRHVGRMLALAGVEGSAGKSERVVALEKRLAGSHWTAVESRDPKLVFNRIDLVGLEKRAPRFPWKAYLAALGRDGLTTINVTTPKNVDAIGKLVTEVPMADWRAYLAWQFLDAHAGALPRSFVEEDFRFDGEFISGQKELAARWKRCVRATDRALGEALGRAFVRRHFTPAAKNMTVRMTSELERAFGQRLDGLPWMDAPTRTAAHGKLAKFVNKIGYPDVWRRYEKLTVSRDSHLANHLAAAVFETHRDLDKIGRPVDRKEWSLTPPTVNAGYEPQLNDIIFPAGILQPPFFDPRSTDAVNYGALGLLVGHEITHGFDDQGRQFDGDGNVRDWWSAGVGKEFTERAQCLVKQFGAYVAIDDVHVNGELTLGENIADLGGLQTAYAAYLASRAGRPAAPAVGGFDDHQQFFLGHAQAWCMKITDEFLRTITQSDPHAPDRLRVVGTLANMPEFAQAFHCKEGSPMVRPAATRCRVW
jgi:putative endopeptidase